MLAADLLFPSYDISGSHTALAHTHMSHCCLVHSHYFCITQVAIFSDLRNQ